MITTRYVFLKIRFRFFLIEFIVGCPGSSLLYEGFSPVAASWGCSLGALTSLVAKHGLWALELSSWGSWASLFLGMWNLPGPAIKPTSSTLAGGFLTLGPGTSQDVAS